MEIGVGLPATVAGISGSDLLEWARRAEAGPFSSLGIIDRLVYSNYEGHPRQADGYARCLIRGQTYSRGWNRRQRRRLIGAHSAAAIRRIGMWADGFMAGLGSPRQAIQGFAIAEESWQAAERPGRPRFVAALYYGLGDPERARSQFVAYYAYKPELVKVMHELLLTSPEAITQAVQSYASIGVDEFIFWPALGTVDQLDRLADLLA